uniref:uncharacterized protein LOC124064959 isoform X2 n=1 Tax=Scatophagus argus TaxID=75038 RepID=UPI001ED83B41|nr:uncharacterized protein LOC124064959 isoform X2 [Scatophagus argus]
MATTETMFPDRSDFDYVPAHLVPKFQRQKYLLKLYRKCSIYLKERRSSQEPRQRIHTIAVPLMANIPLPTGSYRNRFP